MDDRITWDRSECKPQTFHDLRFISSDDNYGDDHNDEGSRGASGGDNGHEVDSSRTDVCRDYMKNVCTRGAGCKYYHPPHVAQQQNSEREEFKFCIDYQNPRSCQRSNCR